jgi:S-adenosyl-L-methionine hydrolase (adenosine-forming)
MIVLVTDFGTADPYVGQMHAVIRGMVDTAIVDLLHHVPDYDIRAGAYLLDALQKGFQPGTVFVGVVDPGVGGARAPVIVNADGKWFVGPDNGLFNVVCRRADSVDAFRIDWRPTRLSASFHGRDLFAPVAARLAAGEFPERSPWSLVETPAWPEELHEIVYIDHYGNAMTGIRADALSRQAVIQVGDERLQAATTFVTASAGKPFWYRNSLDLVEIAVREDSAAAMLGLKPGDGLKITDYESLLETRPRHHP